MSLESVRTASSQDVATKFAAGDLLSSMQAWNNVWPTGLEADSVNSRTVRNWLVQSKTVELQIVGAGTSQDIERVVDVLVRILSAAIAAESAGRISAAQAADIEAAYNAAWT